MKRKTTWEAYAEYAGGRVHQLGSTIERREDAEALAKMAIDYDANEMGSTVTLLKKNESQTSWITDGTICGAYLEWEDE